MTSVNRVSGTEVDLHMEISGEGSGNDSSGLGGQQKAMSETRQLVRQVLTIPWDQSMCGLWSTMGSQGLEGV